MRLKKTILLLLVLVLAALLVRYFFRGSSPSALSDAGTAVGAVSGDASDAQPANASRYTAALGAVSEQEGGGITISYDDGRESVSFPDVNADDWYVDALNFVVSNDLMSGTTSDGGAHMEFQPDHGMTRAQFAVLLYRFAGGEAAEGETFSDVAEGSWYYDGVAWVTSHRLLYGKEDGSFGVDDFLSCSETLAALYRLAGSPKNETALSSDYPYASKVDEQYLAATIWAWNLGLIEESDCVWYPTQAVSRAQIALLLRRYDLLVGFPAA